MNIYRKTTDIKNKEYVLNMGNVEKLILEESFSVSVFMKNYLKNEEII